MLWVKPRTVTFPFYPTPKSNIPSCKSYGRVGVGVANSLLFLPLYSLDESHKTLLEQFFSSIFWVKLRTVIFPVKLRHRFNPSGQVTFGTLPLSHLLAPNPGILLHSGHSIPDTGNKKKLNWIPVWWRFTLLSVKIFFFFNTSPIQTGGGFSRAP